MEAPPLERKLAAILAADVEGYSRLMHADEERTLATLTSHRAIIDALIESANGQIFGTAGDSVLAEFTSVVHAFNCAVAMQQSLQRANAGLPDDQRMEFRIGINVGDVMVKDGDIFGDGVNIAARLEGLAEAGGICVTRGVRDHLRDRLDADFEDLGEHKVKNISRPIRVFKARFDRDAEPVVTAGVAPPEVDAAATSTGPSKTVATSGTEDPAEIAFWESVQANDDPEEYRLYLERFPNGTFADLARTRMEGKAPADEADVEVAFWESVRDSESKSMVEAYIERYPNGRFVSLAEILVRDLNES